MVSPSTAGAPFYRCHGFCGNSQAKHHASGHSFRDRLFRARNERCLGIGAMVLNCSGCPAQYSTFLFAGRAGMMRQCGHVCHCLPSVKKHPKKECDVMPASRMKNSFIPGVGRPRYASLPFCSRAVRFRSSFVQLSCFPCPKSLPVLGMPLSPRGMI